jgi:ABC-type nitrate/sulfonate/bicarbonate transport system permease component
LATGAQRFAPEAASRLGRLAVQLLGIAAAIGLWQLASNAIGPFTMPPPATVLDTITTNFFKSEYLASHGLADTDGYLPHLLYSVRNVVAGVLLGTGVGVGLGLASLRFPLVSEVVAPVTATFGAAPIVVAAPFFLIWFGIVAFAQILIVTFYTALLMYIFSRRAGDNVRPEFVESALTLGAGPWSIFRWVYVPATVPEIIAGFRIALAGSWGLEAIAELLGAQQGAGLLIKFYANAFVVDGMLALVLLLGLISVILDRLAIAAGRYLTRWAESGHTLQL